jgi:hypothetical protein
LVRTSTHDSRLTNSMKQFSLNVILFLIIGYGLNLIGGEILYTKQRVLTEKKLFYPNLRMKEFYSLAENIDIVFLGSSRCYQGFDPAVVDSITGMNSFNLGSSSQTPVTSYYLLKEVYKKHQLKYVIMELSIDVLNTEQLVNGGYIIDAMDNSMNKLDFFLNGFDFKEQVELLLPFYRYRENRGFFYYAITEDIDEHYDRKRIYHSKGFVENYNDVTEGKIYQYKLTDNSIRNLKYIKKIAELTNDAESELIFVYTPYPSDTRIVNQAEFSDKFLTEIEGLPGEFINNLEDSQEFGDEYFADGNHLNLAGADKLSQEIAEHVKMTFATDDTD